MITTSPNRLLAFAGLALLVAIGLLIPLDAFAADTPGITGTTDLKEQTNTLGTQLVGVPKLIAFGSYVIGAFFAVRALFALKGFIEAPDDNPLTRVLAYAAVAALLILLPYILTVMANTIGAKNTSIGSSATSFQNAYPGASE